MKFLMDLRSGPRRLRSPFLLFQGLLSGTLLISGLTGQTAGPRPGQNKPLKPGGHILFSDQELVAFAPTGANGAIETQIYRTNRDQNLSLSNQQNLGTLTNTNPIVATSGRVFDPARASIIYAQRPMGGSVINLFMREAQSSKSYGFGNLAQRGTSQYDTDNLALAAGDLDQVVDSQDNYRDEVALVYSDANGTYRLIVVSNWNQPLQRSSSTIEVDRDDSADPNLLTCDVPFGVTIGDFDGDGQNEIAVAVVHPRRIGISIFRFTRANETSNGSLQEVGKFDLPFPSTGVDPWNEKTYSISSAQKTISLQATDLNNDGVDELVVGYVYSGVNTARSSSSSQTNTFHWDTPAFSVLRLAQNFTLARSSTFTQTTCRNMGDPGLEFPGAPSFNWPGRLQVALGQFLLVPNGNPSIPFGQHQIVAAWSYTFLKTYDRYTSALSLETGVQAYQVSGDALKITPIGPVNTLPTRATNTWGFSLVAGGFTGNANVNQPTQQLALNSLWGGVYQIQMLTVNPAGVSFATNRQFGTVSSAPSYRTPLVAVDWDGESLYLGGVPTHITVENPIATDYIIEEPPKHSFWDQANEKVTNVSNFDSSVVKFSYANGASSSSKSTDRSNGTVGESREISAGGSVSYETNILLAKVSGEASAGYTKKVSYESSQIQDKYASQTRARTFTISATTDHDDYLYGRTQLIDIWRYRAYGVTQANKALHAFYDVMLPGPSIPFSGGGLGFDWYQPIHENGNILTYPQTPINGSNPADLGSYTDSDGKAVTAPLIPLSQWAFDGTGGTQKLTLTTAGGSGRSVDYTHRTSESEDITAGFKASVKVGSATVTAYNSNNFGSRNEDSWGSAETSDNTTTTETDVEMIKSSGDVSQSYRFNPLLYITQDGTFKMSFFVPNPSYAANVSGGGFWASRFGQLPDPALNLPQRFTPTTSTSNTQNGWAPNTSPKRKLMRGLFFRQTTRNPVTQKYDFLGSAPRDGDQVRIEARVYNESTAKSVDNVTVKFQKIALDSSSDNEICAAPLNAGIAVGGLLCPASARTDIGQTVVAHLDPLQFTCLSGVDDPQATQCRNEPVFINWNTQGSGPNLGTSEYRIYVVLVPSSNGETYGSDGLPMSIQSIKQGTSTDPVEITTTVPHGLQTDDYVTIAAPGLQLKAEGNIFQVTKENETVFKLNGTKDVRGTYTGGGTVTFLNPGENNEGYRRFDVQSAATPHASSRLQSAAMAQEASSDTAKEDSAQDGSTTQFTDYLVPDSLQVAHSEADVATGATPLATGFITTKQHNPLRLRASVFSSTAHTEGATLLLFDGNPAEGAPAIASQLVHPGNNDGQGTYAWFDWTPETAGTHHLYAKLLENGSDTNANNNVSNLEVQVQ